MARKARIQYASAVYHILDRGDRREAIFLDDDDRVGFLGALGETCGRTGWRVHAWVLMGNHYHLMVETPEPNLVAGMQWFQTTWTMRFNRRHGLSGHLFQGRYKAVVVDGESGGYFATLSDYIHLNPVRARLVDLHGRLYDYPWSSYRWYAATAGRKAWFEAKSVLGELGLEDTVVGRRAYAVRMRERAVAVLTGEEESGLSELRRGWCLGGASFRERMLGLIDGLSDGRKKRRRRDAVVERDHGLDEAKRILQMGLDCLGLSAAELPELAKGDERKGAIAAEIRRRTTVPNQWIAETLHLGHFSRVSHCLRKKITPRLAKQLVAGLAR